jgi:nitrogen PTS system EIIA component
MDEKQVAAYLGMDLRRVQKLAARGQIPCRKVSGQFVFLKGDLDHWAEQQMPQLSHENLADIEKGVRSHHGFDQQAHLVCTLIPDGGIEVPLEARTRAAVIRRLVDLAEKCELVYDAELLVGEVTRREELCSTAMAPFVAIPHPRHPLPYDIAASFVVVGLTASGIPYGAVDGSLTRLFFLICCKDERTHLHVLARLARILYDRPVVEEFLAAESAEQLRSALVERERALPAGD